MLNKFSFVFFAAHFMCTFARLNRFRLQFASHFYALAIITRNSVFSPLRILFRINAHLYGEIAVIFDAENFSKNVKVSNLLFMIFFLFFFSSKSLINIL